MLPFRRIAGFFARLAVIYALFVIPWPGIKTVYAALFRTGGNLVIPSFVRNARNKPRGSVVGQNHSVLLQGPQNHLYLRIKWRKVEIGPKPKSLSHGWILFSRQI